MRDPGQQKKIFLILSITIPFVLYCVYYYGIILKNAPYRFAEFDHVSIAYGPGDSLVNRYDSKTGLYQYIDSKDSLVKIKLHLTQNDFLFLHRKAADLGFWDFPSNEPGDSTKTVRGQHPLHYIIEFGYKRKTKRVNYWETFNGDPKLIDANQQLIKVITGRLNEAEALERGK